MQIRPLTEAEMTSASQLVRQVLGEHVEATYPEEAKSAFYAFIEPENLDRMRAENEAILIGCGDEMGLHACGLIRSGGHIGFLAVEPGFQRQGLGKQLLHVLCTACFEQYSVTRITVNADPEVQAFYLACGFECRGDMQTESGVSFLPMEKMFSTTDVVSAKKHTGLIAALVGGSILILLNFDRIGQFLREKKVSTYMDDRKEASEVVWEEDEEEFRTPEDAGEDGDMSDTDENDTEAGNPEEESENEWENGPRDYVTILDEDMKDVEVYVEEGIPYRLKEEVYALDEYSGEIHLEFNVHYPQINNSGSLLGSCVAGSKEAKKIMPSASNLKVFWGDLHNHCNLTYGHGDMRDAFEAAKGQLDFVSVTPHAMWPDIPGANDPRLKWVIDYHTGAFKRLREGGYEKYVKMSNEYNKEGEFLTFIGYEAHSMEHGDHVALNYDLDAPLVECTSIEDWKEKAKGHKVFVTPHHMGYQGGYRGYNWKCFTEGDITPFVEMYSRHGLAESDQGDYPYLHDMGPRQWEGTIQYGLEQGHKFGIMASTDQHSGYPGSYGDGRIGVLAPSLTRDAIWEALRTRHVCAATGDKIIIDFRLNDAFMGDVVRSNSRRIYLNVTGESCIDYVDVVKNGQILARMNGPLTPVAPEGDTVRCKVKVDFGWNREERYVHWQGKLSVNKGRIVSVTPCFRGAAFTSPQEGETEFKTHVNRILSVGEKETELDLYSSKNPNTTTAAMQAVILDLEMPKDGVLTADFNGKKFEHTLGELLEGSRSHFMIGWLSEAILFNRAMPESCFTVEHYMEDKEPQRDTDYYYVRVRQRDGQWAWSSPIWAERV